MTSVVARVTSSLHRFRVAVLAVAIYVPLLLTRPGEVVADTKTYLTVDPGGLWSGARFLWDPAWGLGVVPHQNIGYLWPMGPWFWFCDLIGTPDWVAQRLFVATALFAAGTGVMFVASVWGWDRRAGTVAGFIYALSPYPLSYATRLSALILPWAGFGWLLGLVILTARHGGWRRPAAFALVTMTVGGVNASSLMYVGLGVILWLPFGVVVERDITWRQVWTAFWRIGLLTTVTSLWWLAGLVTQGAFGAPILQYSETTETVASGSNAAEAFRGLGYWIFYGGDRLGPWVSAGTAYAENVLLIGVGFVLPVAALVALTLARWRQQAYLMTLMVVGVVVTTGVFPFENPSPAAGWFNRGFGDSSLGLAVRSSPRALPLFLLGLAGVLGWATSELARRVEARSGNHESLRSAGLVVLAVLVAAAGVPSLWTGGYIGAELARDEALPTYWVEVGDYLTATDDGTRTVTFPGNDFSAHRWGNTIDHVLPGLTDRETAIRELIAYSSDPSADLLIALDRRLQEGVADWGEIVAVAARMGMGQLVVQLDLEYERFRTPRPDDMWAQIAAPTTGAAGVAVWSADTPNVASDEFPLLDTTELVFGRPDGDVPAVVVAEVPDATGPVRLVSLDHVVVVAGSGEGLVDLVALGVVQPDELVVYESSTPDWLLDELVDRGARLIITDSERAQARRWKTVRDNVGFTERADGLDTIDDASDARLDIAAQVQADIDLSDPVIAASAALTVAEQVGAVVAATDYGNGISYHPENRAIAAVDGDPLTSWRTGAFGAEVDDTWSVTYDQPVRASSITVVQPLTGDIDRFITEIDLSINAGPPQRIVLTDESHRLPGQIIDLAALAETSAVQTGAVETSAVQTSVVEISVVEISVVTMTPGSSPVGFAEVTVGAGAPVLERIVAPRRLLDRAGSEVADLQFTRLRTDPTNIVREDTEPRLVRSVDIGASQFRLVGDLRLSPRATSEVIDQLIVTGIAMQGAPGDIDQLVSPAPLVTATSTIDGPPAHLPSTIFDGDLSTFWMPQFGPQVGQRITVSGAIDASVVHNTLSFVHDGRHSVPTSMSVSINGGPPRDIAIATSEPSPVPDGVVTVPFNWLDGAGLDGPGVQGPITSVVFELTGVDELVTTDWFSAQPVVAPVAIGDLGLNLVTYTDLVDGLCHNHLVSINGEPVPVRITGVDTSTGWLPTPGLDVKNAIRHGQPMTFESCGPVTHAGGTLLLDATDGRVTGLDLDRVWLQPWFAGAAVAPPASDSAPGPSAVITDESQVSRRILLGERAEPQLLVLNDSFSVGWKLTGNPSQPLLVDGHANAWLIPAGPATEVELVWAPQRVVDMALIASALGVLLCLALALLRRPGRGDDALTMRQSAPVDDGPAWAGEPTWAWWPVAVTAASASLFTRPLYGIVAAVALGVLQRMGRTQLLAWGAAAWVGLGGLYEIYLRSRYDIDQSGSWPRDMRTAHELAWMGLALLMAYTIAHLAVVLGRADRAEPDPEGVATPS